MLNFERSLVVSEGKTLQLTCESTLLLQKFRVLTDPLLTSSDIDTL
jgi:hypothetical protein